MGKINVLSFAVANLIAAGEVVDRPSSVIKELLENAIDAGASRVTVEIQNGGVTLMRVSDDGCGISAEDLPIAIRRHATSKIKDAEDLDGITTLGFRGEALAAISSVSDLRIISKTAYDGTGHILSASAGNILGISEAGCADGTTIIVENLFRNVPARRKFLKRDITEAMAVTAVVEKLALSHPEISIRFICDGNVKLETEGDGVLKNVIYSVFGRDFASKLIEVSGGNEGVTVKGFVGRSDNVKANRNYQNTFINGRYVKSKTISAALEQAYTSYMPSEKFPCSVLFIDINPQAVDVNVHPTKLEVKFSSEKPVFEAVYYTVRSALESNASRPEISMKRSKTPAISAFAPIETGKRESLQKRQLDYDSVPTDNTDAPKRERTSGVVSASEDLRNYSTVPEYRVSVPPHPSYSDPQPAKKDPPTFPQDRGSVRSMAEEDMHHTPPIAKTGVKDTETLISDVNAEPAKPSDDNAVTSGKVQDISGSSVAERIPERSKASAGKPYRIVGEAFYSYVIVERDERLILIDKHAAHERIIFEQLKRNMYASEHSSQMLLLPVEVMLASDEVSVLEQYRNECESIGFEYSCGRNTVSVTAIPQEIEVNAVGDMLTVIADQIKSGTGDAMLTRNIVFEKALYQASCKAAIKAGREYAESHIEWIVARLMELPDVTFCPHGRPVAMEISKKALDRQFERT